MNEKYKIIFSLEKSLYRETSPVVIKSGALVSNTEKGKLHIQLKFKNVSDKRITLLKVKTVLMDSIGRELGEIEKQYLDLGENCNDEFGGNVPIFIEENATRKFFAYVTEVCFEDGSIWNNENVIWESIPIQKSLQSKLNASEALEEFKIVYCKNAKYIPLKYKDLWICACGNINKETHEKCCSCGAKFSDMESVNNETLKKNNIYRNATALVNKNVSSEIEKGIALFERIPDWKDSTTKLEEAKQKLIVVSQNEKDTQEKHAKQKKKNIIIAALSFVAVVVLIIGISIGSSISKANKYEQAQDLIAENSLSGYAKVMDLLDDLKGYENADELYLRASYMYNGNYKEIVKMDNLTEFVIPDGVTKIADKAFCGIDNLTSITIPDSVTSIGDSAFLRCSSLTSVTIGDGVTSIGDSAFFRCDNLTSIVIPDSVTSIGDSAFYGCDNLTSVTIGDSVTSIGDSAFYGCDNLTSVTIGGSVTSIGFSAFGYCTSLTSIVIPGSVTSIGSFAFSDCSSLTSIVIPDSVTSIGFSAFSGCDNLTTIYCRVAAKPLGWDYSWNSASYNKRINVIWGYTGN